MQFKLFTTALFALVTFAASPAQAIYKAYISPAGDDAASCILTEPCKSLTRALVAVDNAGEIGCLDGHGFNFGNASISKSVTIDCGAADGTLPAISLTVNGAGIVVRLRNLKLQGNSSGTAIDFTNGAALMLENCLVHGYSGIAIKFRPSTPGTQLIIKDTIISNNGGGGGFGGGLQVAPQSGGSAGVVFDHATFNFNTTAIVLTSGSGQIGGIMRDSFVSSSRSNGIVSQAGLFISFLIDRSTLSNNVGSAIQSSGTNSFVHIGNSTITANDTGVSTASGGTVQSFKNNQIFGNTTDGTPITAVPGVTGVLQ